MRRRSSSGNGVSTPPLKKKSHGHIFQFRQFETAAARLEEQAVPKDLRWAPRRKNAGKGILFIITSHPQKFCQPWGLLLGQSSEIWRARSARVVPKKNPVRFFDACLGFENDWRQKLVSLGIASIMLADNLKRIAGVGCAEPVECSRSSFRSIRAIVAI